jgi:hypothetical protein
MFDITKWFKKDAPIDVDALRSMKEDELIKIAKENKIDIDEKAEKPVIVDAIKKFVEAKKSEQDKQGQQPKVYKHVCEVDCVFQGKFRKKGDVVLSEKKEVPHFKLVDEEKK